MSTFDEKKDQSAATGKVVDASNEFDAPAYDEGPHDGTVFDPKEHNHHLYDGNYPNLKDLNNDDIEEDSPYPEVRAAVSNMDDSTMVVNTWRMWVLGLFWAIVSDNYRFRL